jgi:hypothetical protein
MANACRPRRPSPPKRTPHQKAAAKPKADRTNKKAEVIAMMKRATLAQL